MAEEARDSSLPYEEPSSGQFVPPKYVRPGEYLLFPPPGVVLPQKQPKESLRKKQKKTVRFAPYRSVTKEPRIDAKRS
ncbi:hypothetical protein BDM02DRAFT_3185505 [Thelephora ganbajun]|uniref:Uncharacterized protein n=1 Tax=Thelephora ganbajun TaxID=370292 RepID=A0ACB6ZKI5_THEGA|nr:hypothetical protein BDM02DRAFT_3185505 [Thelephora ganbajun]